MKREELFLSVVIPFFNEEPNLRELIAELIAVLDRIDGSCEVVLVDDGSTDGGWQLAVELSRNESRLRRGRLPRRQGQSAALAAGFAMARGRWLVTMDADCQNDPRDILEMLPYGEQCELVCGVRVDRHDSLLRKLSSRVANKVRGWFLGDGISDTGCSLKMMRRELVRRLPTFNGMHRFLPALLQLQGARVIEIPVHHRSRQHGRSKYGVHNRLWRGIIDLLAVRWLQARWVNPGTPRETE